MRRKAGSSVHWKNHIFAAAVAAVFLRRIPE
jgi:hypothetical protein